MAKRKQEKRTYKHNFSKHPANLKSNPTCANQRPEIEEEEYIQNEVEAVDKRLQQLRSS